MDLANVKHIGFDALPSTWFPDRMGGVMHLKTLLPPAGSVIRGGIEENLPSHPRLLRNWYPNG
jgi:hypothetical protein